MIFRTLLLGLLIALITPFQAAAVSETRPAVFYPGSRALINLINAERLMKRGQKDGLVMFDLVVSKLGSPSEAYVYRGSPETEKLADEVLGQIRRSTWLPARKDGTPKTTLVVGTVVFAIVDGKPRVRIYLNQEERELMRQSDFISPQLIFESGQKFKLEWPAQAGSRGGTTSVALSVDARGRVQRANLAYESPKGLGFGGEVMRTIREAEFVPAFRSGQPTSTQFELPIFFRAGVGWQWKT